MPVEVHGNFSGKRAVIFGCGYIGGQVAREAVRRGMSVMALTRNAEKAAQLRADGIEVVVADLASDRWHRELRGEFDFALNAVSSGGGGIEGYRRSYLEGMNSILAWLRLSGGRLRLVYTSSTSVYPQDGGVRVDESAPVHARDERSGVLIAAEEQLLRSYANACVLRLAGIYGPARVNLVEQVRMGEASGSPAHHLNLIHRDDACAALWSAWAARPQSAHHVFNVVDDHPTPKGEVTAWLAAKLGVQPPKFTGAPAAGRRAVTPDRIVVNARLKTELSWAPRFPSFREGYETLLSR